jgi:C_GCAxxG_C_C family probable redox protein
LELTSCPFGCAPISGFRATAGFGKADFRRRPVPPRKGWNRMENDRESCKNGYNRRQMLKASLLTGATLLVPAVPGKASGEEPPMPPEKRPEHASDQFLRSMNCSQAILETYAPSMGMSTEMARRVAAAFAGGMGMGTECGAVTGALMVIGLKYGKIEAEDSSADKKTFDKVAEFVKHFKAMHGHLGCSELLGVDMSTPQGIKEASSKGLFTSHCPKFVYSAGLILDKILA